MLLRPFIHVYAQPREIERPLLLNWMLALGPYFDRMRLQANAVPQADPDETEVDDDE